VPSEDLQPYVDWLAGFMQGLGLESAGIHGSATGAQLAIQFARTHPDKTRFVMLENAVHFTDAEREDILANYFPDMSPQEDGSHLMLAWKMAKGLFRQFPWYDDRPEARVSDAQPPTALVHATALAYLHSGIDYARAYKAAFLNEDANNLRAIAKPARVIRWQGSILKRYADRLDNFEWPAHIQMVPAGVSIEERYAAIRETLRELLRL
jgi:pimeloyl-ACP methyl ester carboxylesterase